MAKVINATAKDVAKDLLEELGVGKPYVLDFEHNDRVYLWDSDQSPRRIMSGSELYAMIKCVERRSNVKVYAVTHDDLKVIGETYSLLCASPYPEDWDHMLQGRVGSMCMAYAYVWNVRDDLCSEFGYIALNVCDGVLRRVG